MAKSLKSLMRQALPLRTLRAKGRALRRESLIISPMEFMMTDDLSDDALATALAERLAGRFVYIPPKRRWWFKGPDGWHLDMTFKHVQDARLFLRELAEELMAEASRHGRYGKAYSSDITRLGSVGLLKRVVSLARYDPRLVRAEAP